MFRTALVLVFLAFYSVAPTYAEDWSDVPRISGQNLTESVVGGFTCWANEFCPRNALFPITEFARSSTVSGLQADVNAIRGHLDHQLESLKEQVDQGTALSAVLDTRLPVDGKTSRISFDVSTINDEYAFGTAYVGKRGSFDYSVGYARSDDEGMAKASVGFSW